MWVEITTGKFKKVFEYGAVGLTIIWAGVIFYLSSIPGSDIPQAPGVISFLVHFFLYTTLGVLLALNVFFIKKHWHTRWVYLAFALGMVYALSDEFHQLFVTGRSTDPMDLLIDIIGLITGMFIVAVRLHYVHHEHMHLVKTNSK